MYFSFCIPFTHYTKNKKKKIRASCCFIWCIRIFAAKIPSTS